jgi:hypothetical protein
MKRELKRGRAMWRKTHRRVRSLSMGNRRKEPQPHERLEVYVWSNDICEFKRILEVKVKYKA